MQPRAERTNAFNIVARGGGKQHWSGQMSTQLQAMSEPIAQDGNIFRKTNAHKGRKLAVTPDNSSMRHLSYGRIILDRTTPEAQFETGPRETGLICLSGEAELAVGSERFTLKQ